MLPKTSIITKIIISILILTAAHYPSIGYAHADMNHFTSCDSILSFDYRDELNVYEQDSLIVLTDGDLNSTVNELGENSQRLLIEYHLLSRSFIESPTTPLLISQLDHLNVVWENSHSIRINGQSATFHPYIRFEDGVEIEGFLMTINIGPIEDDFVYINLLAEAVTEAYDTFSPHVFGIAESLTYTPLTQHVQTSYFQNICQFSFTFPTGMIVDERFGQIHLYNAQEARLAGAGGTIDHANHLEIEIISPFEIRDYFLPTGFDPSGKNSEAILMAYATAESINLSSEPTQLTIGEYEALSVNFENETTEGLIYLVRFDENHHTIFSARTGLGGFSEVEAVAYQVAVTLQYNPLQ